MRHKSEAGQALVFTAVAMVALIGFAGLGVDMGMLRYDKRLQQTAADAAAIAGANDLISPLNGGVVEAGQNASATNGFTDSGSGELSTCTASGAAVGTTCVQINNPPQSGPHVSCPSPCQYVEALVSQVHTTYFMRILGLNSEVVTARAVATNLSGVNSSCLYLLGPASKAGSGLTIKGGGNGSIQAPTCGIVDNGDFASGNSANWFATAGSFAVVGTNAGGKGNVTCSSGQSPCPAYSVPAAGNPLVALVPPPIGAIKTWANGDPPGTYSGMQIKGNNNVTFAPGIYVLDGGDFSCKGTPTITGVGVMFYLTDGATWDCAGTPSVSLTAPSPSNCPACPTQYDGILIYQDPNDQNADTLSGTTSTGGYGGLVVLWGLTMNGTDTLTLTGTAGFGTSAVKEAILVE